MDEDPAAEVKMRFCVLVVVAMFSVAALTSDSAAQGRGTVVVMTRGGVPGGRPPGPAPEEVGDVYKGVLKDIKLEKAQNDSVKALRKSFEAQEKELKRVAAMTSRGSSRAGGPGGRRGGSAGPSSDSRLLDAQFELHQKFAEVLRAVMTEAQQPAFDKNLELYHENVQKKLDMAQARAGGRGRG